MHEKLVIVPKRKTTGKKVLNIVFFALTALMLVGSLYIPIICLIPAVIFGLLWYFTGFRGDIEWEYTYYDGELRFAKIKAKSKRKNLARIQMDDVQAFAPKGDRSVYKYETDKNLAFKDLTSGDPEAKVYELVCKGEKGLCRYEFEPDEEMLDAIMVKYSRLVIR